MATGVPDIREHVNWCLENLTGPAGEPPSFDGFARFTRVHRPPGTEGSLRQLATGHRDAPGALLLDAISRYFAVPLGFWTDETAGGTRRYSADDLDRLRRIGELLDAGLNLAGIAMVMELQDENALLRSQHRNGSSRA